MFERLLIAGSGGQGSVLIGKLLATAAVRTIPHVTFFPSYGAEVRGGASSCQVMLSSSPIASPLAALFDSLILMNQTSVDAYIRSRHPDSLVLLNSSLCQPPAGAVVTAIPATDEAVAMGDPRVTNLILLGAYCARKPLVGVELIEACLADLLKDRHAELIEINLAAFRKGLTL
jgi:2-oxoglutarate ferredoxin oxidoreductase subunit gamma